jgi:hypothetical protein
MEEIDGKILDYKTNVIYYTANNIVDKSDNLIEHTVLFNFKDQPGENIITITFNTESTLEPEYIDIFLTNPKPIPIENGTGVWSIMKDTLDSIIKIGIKINNKIMYCKPNDLILKIDFMNHYNASGILFGTAISEHSEIITIYFKFDTRI